MSQKPYMWNRNNPYEYSDPSGYDSIYYYARPVAGPLPAHIFISVRKHKGGTVRYSFGPKDDRPIHMIGSPLVREPQSYDADWDIGGKRQNEVLGSGKLASCVGTCTRENGGFDEASLDKTAASIDGHYTYGLGQSNSDSAFYRMCMAGGGNFACKNPNTNKHVAPGLGQPLKPLASPAPAPK